MQVLNNHKFKGSNTCCQGLVDFGFRINILLFFKIDFIQSGINLSFDQSPPPITLPALATHIKILLFFFEKKI